MDLIGYILKQAVELKRLENGAMRGARASLQPAFREFLLNLKGLPPRSARTLASALLSSFRRKVGGLYETLGARLSEEIAAIARRQSALIAKALSKATGLDVKALDERAPEKIIRSTKTAGRTLAQHLARQQRLIERQIERQTKLSLQLGESPAQLMRRLQRYVFAPARRRAETLAQTHVNAIANRVQLLTMQKSGTSSRYRLVVTLDSRTSIICLSYAAEGKVYRYGDGPVPPFHPRCRTIISPVISGDDSEPPDAERWLKRQSKAVQDDILGHSRAELWRSGRIDISELVRRDRTVRTVAQLEKRSRR